MSDNSKFQPGNECLLPSGDEKRVVSSIFPVISAGCYLRLFCSGFQGFWGLDVGMFGHVSWISLPPCGYCMYFSIAFGQRNCPCDPTMHDSTRTRVNNDSASVQQERLNER